VETEDCLPHNNIDAAPGETLWVLLRRPCVGVLTLVWARQFGNLRCAAHERC